jgi:hypothetical protein
MHLSIRVFALGLRNDLFLFLAGDYGAFSVLMFCAEAAFLPRLNEDFVLRHIMSSLIMYPAVSPRVAKRFPIHLFQTARWHVSSQTLSVS